MTLEDVYFVSQLIGVIALVVSVLYLAQQVKTSNDLNRTNTFRTIFQGLASFCNEVFGGSNSELMVKGFRDFGSLSPAEKMSFDLAMANFFNYIEDSYASAQVNLLQQETLENWSWWLRNRVFPYEGAREWWTASKGLWREEFQDWVERQAKAAQADSDVYGIISST